jgi:hypothetical protein
MNRAPSKQFDCDEVICAASEFLDKPGSKLEVLFEKDFDAAQSPFARLAIRSTENVDVRRVPDDWQARYNFNFLTVDNRAFRFQDDRSTPVAIVAGGKTHSTAIANLDGIFSELWKVRACVEAGPHIASEG